MELPRLFADDTLAPELRRQLEAIPGWSWGRALTAMLERCDLLAEFVATHQRMPSRTDLDARGKRFGTWIDGRRREFRAGKLHTIVKHRLETIPGWRWRVANTAENPHIRKNTTAVEPPDPVLLRQYTELVEHLREPRLPDGTPIGLLTERIRADYRAGQLSRALIQRIERVPGWTWDPPTNGS